MRLSANAGRKNLPKIHRLGTIAQLYRAISSQLRHVSTIGKNVVNSNISSTRPYNMVNFGPLVADICLPVWGTPANFNGFPVLASLMQRHRSTEANQTLQDVWPSPGLVHCTLYMHFRGLLSPNGILPGAKFTASKSCILLYWQRCCMVLEQWASAKLCGVQQEVPSHWASAHILVSTVLLTLKDFSMLEVGLL